IGQFMTSEGEWSSVLSTWRPPPPAAGANTLFPAVLGGYHRTTADSNSAVPDRGLPGGGRHASYVSGSQTVDVYLYHGTALEGEALVNRVKSAVANRGMSRAVMDINGRFSYSFSPPAERGIILTDKGWTIFVRSRDDADTDHF